MANPSNANRSNGFVQPTKLGSDDSANLVASSKIAYNPTTLEKCRDQSNDNMHAINTIGSRVIGLLTRLRGLEPRVGGGSEDDDSEPRGMLVVHLEQLEYEARRLGEIEADLAELERLL